MSNDNKILFVKVKLKTSEKFGDRGNLWSEFYLSIKREIKVLLGRLFLDFCLEK